MRGYAHGIRIVNKVFTDSDGQLLRHWGIEDKNIQEPAADDEQPQVQTWRRGFWPGERSWEGQGPLPGDANELVRRHADQKTFLPQERPACRRKLTRNGVKLLLWQTQSQILPLPRRLLLLPHLLIKNECKFQQRLQNHACRKEARRQPRRLFLNREVSAKAPFAVKPILRRRCVSCGESPL